MGRAVTDPRPTLVVTNWSSRRLHGPGRPNPARVVRDGDTLCFACSRAHAARGLCHRVWAAELLVAAGWRVVLDGVALP